MLKLFLKTDHISFFSMVLLTILGIFMIFSSSVGEGQKATFVNRQILYLIFAIGVFLSVSLINYKILLNNSHWLYLGTVVLLLVTIILGLETRGSTRWIDLGIINLQASEIAKPVLVLFLTKFLVKNSPKIPKNILLSFLIMIVPTFMIFKQPDLGSAVVLFLIWVGLIYVAGLRFSHFFLLGTAGLILLPIGFSFLKNYQKERLLTFLNPDADPLGSGYNVVQSIIAVGSGEFFGRGFGRGTQSHLNFLPEQKTDFIFATTAEELGFVGILLLLGLFTILLFRIINIATVAEKKEGALLCYGAAFVVAIQLFINAGMNMGLLPITGITLPFVSFGGSSLISMAILLGLVNSVYLSRKKQLI